MFSVSSTRSFRDTKTFIERCNLSRDLIAQYPHCIPVVVERAPDETRLPIIDKKQFLVPHEMLFGSFFFMIRKRIGEFQEHEKRRTQTPSASLSFASAFTSFAKASDVASAQIGMWLYAGKLPITTPSSKMSEIYHYYKDNDGFLYLKYRGENVFGSS